MHTFLAIDQGTHASRALVLDDRGRVLARQQRPVSLTRPGPGRVEQDADEILASVQSCVTAVLEELGPRQRDAVRACGITTQRSTVLAWRRDGTPMSPAISWQDTRGAAQVEALRPHGLAIQRASGLALSPHYGASKLHLLREQYPDTQLRLGPLAAYLVQHLSDAGSCVVDHANAQRMQLFDIRTRDWSSALCDLFRVPLQSLPSCRPVCADYGVLRGSGVPIRALCGDQNAAWFGGGAPGDDSVRVNLGSGAFLLAAQSGENAVPGLLSSIARSDATQCDYIAEGTVNGAGNALQWLQDAYGVMDIESHLSLWLQQVREPPLFLNTVGGLGSPWWRQGPAPSFAGETARLTHAELAAGVAESILFLVQRNLECLQQHRTVRRLRVSGGLSSIDALCQRLADLSQLPVERSDEHEASASGVAWLAAGCPGQWSSPCLAQPFAPRADKALAARYRRFLEELEHYLETDARG